MDMALIENQNNIGESVARRVRIHMGDCKGSFDRRELILMATHDDMAFIKGEGPQDTTNEFTRVRSISVWMDYMCEEWLSHPLGNIVSHAADARVTPLGAIIVDPLIVW